MKKLTRGLSQQYYDHAKTLIPGGTQILSKRPELFLPNHWPAYYSKAKGIKIWDLDKNCYKDFSIMSVGQCPLGYANKKINNKIALNQDDIVVAIGIIINPTSLKKTTLIHTFNKTEVKEI